MFGDLFQEGMRFYPYSGQAQLAPTEKQGEGQNWVISFSGKFSKIVATRCQILRLKCTK